MKSSIGIVLMCIPFLLGSCTSYYYSILNSGSHRMEKKSEGDFVIENDSVCITYNFGGMNAPIGIHIYNKMGEPLHVDWQKSALILNGEATSYQDKNMPIAGQLSTSSYEFFSFEESEGVFSGNIEKSEKTAFIPPKSGITYVPLELAGFPFDEIPKKEYNKASFLRKNGTEAKINYLDFTPENSPLTFRSYLVLFAGMNPDFDKPIIYETEFYVSKLIKTGAVKPSDFYVDSRMRGDIFYVEKRKGYNTGYTIGAILLGVSGAVVSAALEVPAD